MGQCLADVPRPGLTHPAHGPGHLKPGPARPPGVMLGLRLTNQPGPCACRLAFDFLREMPSTARARPRPVSARWACSCQPRRCSRVGAARAASPWCPARAAQPATFGTAPPPGKHGIAHYPHRQGGVILGLRLMNQPGSCACPAGVSTAREVTAAAQAGSHLAPGRCLPGESPRAPRDAPRQTRPAPRCPP